MAAYKKLAWMKRYKTSSAYVDSFTVSVLILVAVILSAWIAYAARNVINAWWLGGSIMTILLYNLIILWVIRQFYDIYRIFFTYVTGILCLSIIISVVSSILGLQLPTDLPILNHYVSEIGNKSGWYNSGSVVVMYAFIVGLISVVVALPLFFLDNSRVVRHLVIACRFDKVDFVIDSFLDRLGFWIDTGKYGWLIVLFGLLAVVCLIVVGGAVLIR